MEIEKKGVSGYTALLWQKEASDNSAFPVKEQNVSVTYTDVNGKS